MKFPRFFHCLCFIWLALRPGLLAQVMSPALKEEWDYYYSDVGTDQVRRTRAEHELATRPDFKPELFAILQQEYFDAVKLGERGSAGALGALALRNDLTPAEQKLITDELETHVASTDESPFIRGAINLLAHYPSPEHEALVLRFLNRSAKQRHTLRAAFDTLAEIGGEKSLAAMREVAARMKAENPQYSFLEDLNLHLSNLQYRLEHKTARAAPSPAAPASVQPLKATAPTTTTTATSPETFQVSTTDWRVWLGLLGGLILVIALSCRLFYKR